MTPEERVARIESLARNWNSMDYLERLREGPQVDEALCEIPGPWNDGPLYLRTGTGSMLLQPTQLLSAICELMTKGASPAEALESLEHVIGSKRATVLWMLGIIGPQVNEELDVGGGIKLLPGSMFPWRSPEPAHPSASCCITREFEVEDPVGGAFSDSARQVNEVPGFDLLKDRDALDDVMLLMALLSVGSASLDTPMGITSLGATFVHTDPVLRAIPAGVGLHGAPGQVERQFWQRPTPISLARLAALREGFVKMQEGDRTRIRIAADRTNRAALQAPVRPTDACIEVIIALEALFAGAGKDSAAHKIATRAARYSEDDFAGRATLRRFLKQCYTKRGNAVHGQITKAPSTEDLARLCRVAAAAASKMVANGSVPSEDAMDL